ncbi:MAG: hypothetical protein ACTSR3_21165, partial [Candidatus Helarchaeota archaeon]
FHIEFTPSIVEELVNQYIDDFVEDQTLPSKIIKTFKKYYPEIKVTGFQLIHNFLKIVTKTWNQIKI